MREKINVESFEHACELEGIAAIRPDLSGIPEEFRAKLNATYELDVISKAQGNGFEPDYNDYEQKKWGPIFAMNAPGFRLGGSGYDFADAGTTGGSRPLPTKADSDYLAEKFIHLFAAFHGAKKIAP